MPKTRVEPDALSQTKFYFSHAWVRVLWDKSCGQTQACSRRHRTQLASQVALELEPTGLLDLTLTLTLEKNQPRFKGGESDLRTDTCVLRQLLETRWPSLEGAGDATFLFVDEYMGR